MRYFILLFITGIFLISCEKSENNPSEPTAPEEEKFILTDEYKSAIDTAYYREWSDGTWEKFSRVQEYMGKDYIGIMTSDSIEHFYDETGYAGFRTYSEILKSDLTRLFSDPIPYLPDTLFFNRIHSNESGFADPKGIYTVTVERTLTDTSTAVLSFGSFSGCLHLLIRIKLFNGETTEVQNIEYWISKELSYIKYAKIPGNTVFMVRGIIHGEEWGY